MDSRVLNGISWRTVGISIVVVVGQFTHYPAAGTWRLKMVLESGTSFESKD